MQIFIFELDVTVITLHLQITFLTEQYYYKTTQLSIYDITGHIQVNILLSCTEARD
jgi:hypothetical protein